MSDLVARTGRHQQRYDAGCRLIAGLVKMRLSAMSFTFLFTTLVEIDCFDFHCGSCLGIGGL
ncbi:hypothetical protein SDJN02_07938 [Cucurbita argyrosperma subsp. argyrosperma]|nr:hypothetical protein SDJN02_07938 [Cucurbita argyrosperma subsp. argyrosperma]